MTPVLVLLLVFLRASRNVVRSTARRRVQAHRGPGPGHVLPRRPDVPRRTGPDPAGAAAPDRVLPDHVVRRGARRAVQRPGRPARVHVHHRVPDRPGRGAAACCRRSSQLLNPEAAPGTAAADIWDLVLPLLFFAAARFLSAYYSDVVSDCQRPGGTGSAAGDVRRRRRPDGGHHPRRSACRHWPATSWSSGRSGSGRASPALWVGTFLTFVSRTTARPDRGVDGPTTPGRSSGSIKVETDDRP